MIFTKMHGLGNDYVCINCFRERVEDPSGFARTLVTGITGRSGWSDSDMSVKGV